MIDVDRTEIFCTSEVVSKSEYMEANTERV